MIECNHTCEIIYRLKILNNGKKMWELPVRTRSNYTHRHGTELALFILLLFVGLCIYLCFVSSKKPLVLIAAIPLSIFTCFQLYKTIKDADEHNSLICDYFTGGDLPVIDEKPRKGYSSEILEEKE